MNNNTHNIISPESVNNVTQNNVPQNNYRSTVQNNNQTLVNPTNIATTINSNKEKPSVVNKNQKKISKAEKLNKISNSKGFKLILIIIGILIILYIIIKILLLIMYNNISDYPEYIKEFEKRGNIAVSSYEYPLNDEECIILDQIKFINQTYNDFTEEEIKSLNGSIGKKFSNIEYNSSLTVNAEYTYTDLFAKDLNYYSTGINKLVSGSAKSRKKILDKNKITNDLDLFNLMNTTSNEKINFFTSINQIINKSSLKLFASTALPQTNQLYVISGEYNGYVLIKENSYREINIEHNNKRYVILVTGNYFSDEMFQKILNTITFK